MRLKPDQIKRVSRDESAKDELVLILKNQHVAYPQVFPIPLEEHVFALEIGRKWRWDIAYLERKIAIEVNGGIWTQGAHGHPVAIMRNMEKLNWGARLGWRVLSFDTKEVKNGRALLFIESVLRNKREKSHAESLSQPRSAASRRGAHPVG